MEISTFMQNTNSLSLIDAIFFKTIHKLYALYLGIEFFNVSFS